MSEDNKGLIDPKEIKTDMTFEEEQDLQKFVEKDMPGLSAVTDDQLAQLFSMYMKGKTYTEIAQAMKVKKQVLLCLSHQNDWYLKKAEYYNAIQKNIQNRLIQTKIDSVNFLADVIGAYHKDLGDKVAKVLATGGKITEFLDGKEMTVYFRALEKIENMATPKRDPGEGKPGININISGDAKTKVSDDGKTLEIESSSTGEILKNLANLTKANKKD
jgi:hypothetical protein